MRFSIRQIIGRRHQSGQTMALFLLFLVALILVVGLGIDMGFVYITKAQLSKAVDSACLAALAHYSEGQTAASDMAKSTFRANYGVRPGRDTATIVPTVNFGTTSGGNISVSVGAATTINTFFIRVLPQWHTMRIADDAQAVRANAIITLVIDRSNSMDRNCPGGPCGGCSFGSIYLPNAVKKFIQHFDDNLDQAALVSFASTAITNVSMRHQFKNTITSATTESAILWEGGTFAQGGLTNALAINNAVNVPAGQNALKVIVFFTDGQPNMVQNRLTCPDGSSKLWNFGGNPCLTGPNSAVPFFASNAPYTQNGQANASYYSPPVCSGSSAANRFPSVDGQNETFTMPHVMLDASNRCVQVADQARNAGMLVYAIGLDTDGIGVPQARFLNLVANSTDSPAYNRNLPTGLAFNVGDGSGVEDAFQQVAADILLRLIE